MRYAIAPCGRIEKLAACDAKKKSA